MYYRNSITKRFLLHLLRIISYCMFALAAAYTCHAQADTARVMMVAPDATEIFRFGVFGGINLNLHTVNFSGLPGVPSCCPTYESGNGTGMAFGGLFYYPLDKTLWLGARVYLSTGDGTLEAEEIKTIDSNGDPVLGTFGHTIAANISNVFVEPGIRYRLMKRLDLLAGIGIGYTTGSTYAQEERILSPSNVRFENNRRVRMEYSGDIPDASTIQAALNLGASYELPLASNIIAAPELAFSFGLTSIVDGISWNVHTLRAGLSLQYVLYNPPYVPVPPKPQPPPPPPVVPEIKLPVLAISSNLTYRDDQGKQQPLALMIVERINVGNTAALLNYVFFDANSAEIPERYNRITSDVADTFTIRSLKQSSMEIYYDVLNVYGRRLRDNPSQSITLVGCNSDDSLEQGGQALSRSRAETILDYLVNTWQINPDRIRVQARNLPENASRSITEDGRSENRRVEILADSWELNQPIFYEGQIYKSRIPRVDFMNQATAEAGMKDWSLSITQNSSQIESFKGTGDIPGKIEWSLEKGGELKTGDDFAYTLQASDNDGQTRTTDPHVIKVQVADTVTKIRVEKYNLIIFPYNSSELTDAHRRIADLIKTRMEPNSTLTIVGYADRTGEAEYNQRLSTDRAKGLASLLKVPDDRAYGIGNAELLFPNDLPEGRFYCRTVTVEVKTPVE